MEKKFLCALVGFLLVFGAGFVFASGKTEPGAGAAETAKETVLRATMTATPESLDPATVIGENDWKIARHFQWRPGATVGLRHPADSSLA